MKLMPMMKQQWKSMVTQYKSRVSVMSLQKVQTEAVVEIVKVHQNAAVGNREGIAYILLFEEIAGKLVIIVSIF